MLNVGFIGLGAMGGPISLHLLRRGYPLGVYARRPAAAATIVAAGAALYDSPAALGAASDIVITMITGTNDVEQVLLGAGGAAERARAGTTFVDMSTISPAATVAIGDALAARGLGFVDAPVSGGPMGAENATLTIMAGGRAEALARVGPILESVGTIFHVGGVGAGQTTKACHQMVLLITAEAAAEGLALAARCGLDPALVRQVMLRGIASSRVLELFGERMARRAFDAGIPVRLYEKDLGFVADTAERLGQPLPAMAVVESHLRTLMERGDGHKDLSVLIEMLESKVKTG
jgi:2-hydroxy-3-oxopropionate reductase